MPKPKQKTTIRQKVRHTLHRLGMQAKAQEVVDALAQFGLTVSEGFVERVRLEELKGRDRGQTVARRSNRIGKRHQAKKIPQKRPWRR